MIYMFKAIIYCLLMCFENFRNKCTEICELDPAHFVSAPELARQTCLKKTGAELKLSTDYDMLLMAEKCDVIHRYAKASSKYMKSYVKSIISSYLMYLDANNSFGWGKSQKLSLNGFKSVEDLSQVNKDFINYDENSDNRYMFKVELEYPKKLFNHHKD